MNDVTNAAVSTAEGGIMVFLLKEIMPWTLHTISAIASAAVVAIVLFILNRWLNNSPFVEKWLNKFFPKKKH